MPRELSEESDTIFGDQTSYVPTQVAETGKEHRRRMASQRHILAK